MLGLARDTHQAAHALDDLIKAWPPSVRAVLPKARNAGQNDARVDLGQRLVVDAQFVFNVGSPVLYHHIRLGHQAHQYFHGARFFEVEGHRPLVAVDVLKIAAFSIGSKHGLIGIDPRGWFDTNDIRTKVGQDAHAIGTRTNPRQVNDFESRKGAGSLNFRHLFRGSKK